ncbi:ankyrin repeat-containing protein [Phytophthora cinnamomi]|uniref:ankyrin repeat-containing protein n=1 Tax=Phytophthora cinnamomi TaxID=4785 RepID=UPI003559C963|nr:ankyrin repeat-containing protein [Phytophthora cinnamomi]
MLQGLRRKIGRYAPRGGAAKEAPTEKEPELRENATPLEAAVWHFNRQDKALRRLETEMTHMVEQIQVACATMATVAEIFSETCSGKNEVEDNGEYKVTMKQIEQEEAERMEQSIRFTVLDPLQARLERHDQLREQIGAWEKLAAESKMLRAVTLKMQSSRLEDDDKRAQTEMDLHRVAEELQEAEKKLLPQLDDAVLLAAASALDLFSTTRLQTAIFFRNTSESVLSSLTSAEREVVAEANQPLKIPLAVKLTTPGVSLSTTASKLNKMSSLTSDGWTEVDGSSSSTAPDGVEAISGSDEESPPIDTSGSANQSAANSPRKSGEQLIIIPQSPTEWLAIEECLWEIDAREARSPGKALLTADSISSGTEDLLTGLFQKHDGLYFECLSYLRVEDLARLSKVNFRLHSHLVDTAPIWKKRCSMYEQLLEKVGTKLAVGLDAVELSLSEDDAQLAVWFREIDVDVVRTCHRSIYAKNGDAMPSSPSASPSSADDDDDDDEDTVKSILSEMIELVVIGEGEEVPSTDSHDTPAVSSSNTRNPDLEAKIRRVLRAYVVYNPRVGYCQGMGFLVRLLAEVAVDEADIFWLFVGFSEPENDRNLYEPGMAVLQPYLSKFELLFSTHMPELYTHFQTEGVHVATFCTRWFLTFFSSFETLAPTLVIRLLDIFIIDGWRVMFSVSLVILDELQEELMKCDMEGILRVLQFPRSLMPDPDQLRQRQLVRHALAFSISRAINSI